VLGGVPLLVATARDARNPSVTVTIMAIIGGAAAAWLVDDAPGEVLTPVPIGPSSRRVLRAAYVILVAAATLAAFVALASSLSDAEISIRAQIPLVVASACISLAIAIVAYRNGEPSPGAWGVPGSVVAIVVTGGLAFRFPGWLPTLAQGPSFAHWWYVAAAALVATLVAGRDPGARHHRVRLP
jgi:hypothetical protein